MKLQLVAIPAVFVLAACVTTVEPVIPEAETFDESLIGVWATVDDDTAVVSRAEGEEDTYLILYDDSTREALIRYEGRLGYLNDRLALELGAAETPPGLLRPLWAMFFIEIQRDTVVLMAFDNDSLAHGLQEGTVHLQHILEPHDGGPDVLLGGSSERLRRELDAYARSGGPVDSVMIWTRVEPGR